MYLIILVSYLLCSVTVSSKVADSLRYTIFFTESTTMLSKMGNTVLLLIYNEF